MWQDNLVAFMQNISLGVAKGCKGKSDEIIFYDNL